MTTLEIAVYAAVLNYVVDTYATHKFMQKIAVVAISSALFGYWVRQEQLFAARVSVASTGGAILAAYAVPDKSYASEPAPPSRHALKQAGVCAVSAALLFEASAWWFAGRQSDLWPGLAPSANVSYAQTAYAQTAHAQTAAAAVAAPESGNNNVYLGAKIYSNPSTSSGPTGWLVNKSCGAFDFYPCSASSKLLPPQ